MDKLQAQNIIKQTFENPFNKERFIGFVKNLLNHIKEAPFTYQGQYIPEAYRGYIQSLERIGKYEAEGSKIDILIIKLQKNTSLERARTMQRNFVAWYLNGSRGGELKDAAIVAYVAPGDEDWRFSLVKMDYKFTETKTGKMKAKEEFTPARRWSFLVGANEKSHTAQSRLIDILTQDEGTLGLATLEDAFNIEKVTKEFFEKYRELFLRTKETLEDIVKKDSVLKKDFTKKNVSTVDFCKKLLGQIVFLYFLQKKGWFGVPMNKKWGEGDKKFLRTLFDRSQAKNKNYFNDYLEPLFYEALARERDDDFYSRFECKIPFLNGGLFDPISNYDWVNTVINLKDEIFSNQTKTKEGDIGDGILDVFDRYNFTVKEDEPLEKEVAVDPEMLGKVFENLLEVKDRKSKGTYYTPREIVHYMCEQSLINYLATELKDKVNKESLEQFVKYSGDINEQSKTNYPAIYTENICQNAKLIDALLAEIKVCDPAIGSGAFPVGMMSEIVKVRVALNKFIKEPERTVYRFKRNCIQSSLYGVDIEPGAVEIAKLRLWLSLIVDEDDIKQIKPLPNLDYKIMQGNSLLEEFEGIRLFDEKFITSGLDQRTQINTLKQRQQELQREYLHPKNKLTERKKAELEKELEVISKQIKKLNKPDKHEEAHPSLFDTVSEAKKKADELKLLHKNFFEATQKKEKDAIKNRIEQLEWELIEATLEEQNKTSELKKLADFKNSNTKPFFLWKLNFSEVFQEKGGFDIVVANPPYIASYGRQAKKFTNEEIQYYIKNYKTFAAVSIRKKISINTVMLFFEKGFDLLKNFGCLSYIIDQAFLNVDVYSYSRKYLLDNSTLKEMVTDLKFPQVIAEASILQTLKNKPTEEYNILWKKGDVNSSSQWISSSEFVKNGYQYTPSLNINILKGIENRSIPLAKCAETFTGMQIIPEYFLSDDDNVLSLKKWHRAVFSSNIEKYRIVWPNRKQKGKYITYDTDLQRKVRSMLQKKLEKGEKCRAPESLSIGSDEKEYRFSVPKIIMSQTVSNANKQIQLQACVDDEVGYYGNVSIHLIKHDNLDYLKYLIALVNSRLMSFYAVEKKLILGAEIGSKKTPQIRKGSIDLLPIKNIQAVDQKPFIEIVNKILVITKASDYLENLAKKEEVKEYEKQIDQLVYKLYDLTSEEIEIVENTSKK